MCFVNLYTHGHDFAYKKIKRERVKKQPIELQSQLHTYSLTPQILLAILLHVNKAIQKKRRNKSMRKKKEETEHIMSIWVIISNQIKSNKKL